VTSVLGIVAALEMEGRWISASEPLIEVSGGGEERAGAAARRLLDRGASALVSWGVAGGLDPDLEPGTVVLPDVVIHADGSSYPIDVAWRDRLLERVSGRVVTSTSSLYHASSVITSPDEKRAVYGRVGAGAVDMESAAVAAVASEMEIPFVVVRVVVDAAGVRLPEVALTMCDEAGRLKKSAVLGLIFQPGEWRGMLRLGRANGAAGRSMRKLWSAAGPDLALAEVRK
jgi:hopanoid-associated phosphorylase